MVKTSAADPGEKAGFYIITCLDDGLKQVVQTMALRWVRERNESQKLVWICHQVADGATALQIQAHLAPAFPALA